MDPGLTYLSRVLGCLPSQLCFTSGDTEIGGQKSPYCCSVVPPSFAQTLRLIFYSYLLVWMQHMQDEDVGRPYRKFLWAASQSAGGFRSGLHQFCLSESDGAFWNVELLCQIQMNKGGEKYLTSSMSRSKSRIAPLSLMKQVLTWHNVTVSC